MTADYYAQALRELRAAHAIELKAEQALRRSAENRASTADREVARLVNELRDLADEAQGAQSTIYEASFESLRGDPCDPCGALMESNAQLRAEVAMLRAQRSFGCGE